MKSLVILSMIGYGGPEWKFLFFILLLAPLVFYLLMLQRILEQVSPGLRKIEPGQVWMLFIPIFNILWNFMMLGYITDSLRDEFRRRNLPLNEERPGYKIGLWMCILTACSWIPFVGFFTAIGALVCWIIYWTKMAEYKKTLERSAHFPPEGFYPPNNPYQQNPGNNYPPSNPNQGF